MKRFWFVLVFSIFYSVSAQRILALDSLKLKEVQDFFADDYGNLYLYKNKDFSFTKFDSVGKQLGRVMMTVPFRVQSVQNPLNIFLFSENAQEFKLLDSNLNEIQKIDFRQKFGFVKSAYAEDLQQVWLLDDSTKRLIQYNYRQDLVMNSFPMNFDFENVVAMLVFNNNLYVLRDSKLIVYNFKSEKLIDFEIDNPRKLYRENDSIIIICKNSILKLDSSSKIKTMFTGKDSQIVDKNSSSYFELKAGKLYLYRLKN